MNAAKYHFELDLSRVAVHRRMAAINAIRQLLPGLKHWSVQPDLAHRPGAPCRLTALGAMPAPVEEVAAEVRKAVVDANGRTVPVVLRCTCLADGNCSTFRFGPRGAVQVEREQVR